MSYDNNKSKRSDVGHTIVSLNFCMILDSFKKIAGMMIKAKIMFPNVIVSVDMNYQIYLPLSSKTHL
jgi:hypothetical protein